MDKIRKRLMKGLAVTALVAGLSFLLTVPGSSSSGTPEILGVSCTVGISTNGHVESSTVGGKNITITGNHFDNGTVSVSIGGVAATNIAVVDDTHITCTTPAIATAGGKQMLVQTSNGGVSSAFNNAVYYVNQYTGGEGSGNYTSSLATLDLASVLTLTSPVGSEVWNYASQHNITWVSTAATLQLYYSTNGGTNWTAIGVPQLGSNASYAWTVNAAPGINTKVKIENTGNTSQYAVSPAVFTVVPTLTSVTSNATAAGWLKIGDSITFTATASCVPVTTTGITVTSGNYNGQALTWSTADSGAHYTATYTVTEGHTDQVSAVQVGNVTIALGGNSSLAAGTDVLKTIDANKPTSSVTIADSYYTAVNYNAASTICGTASDGSGSGIASVLLAIDDGTTHYWDGTDWDATTAQWLPVTSGTTDWTYTLAAANLSADKTYTIQSKVTDTAGNVQTTLGSDSFTYTAAPQITSASYRAGAVSNTTIAFTAQVTIPAAGKIEVDFPVGYDLSGSLAYVSGNAGSTVSASDDTLIITVGAQINALSSVSIVVSGIKNPMLLGTTGSYTLRTKNAAGDQLSTTSVAANTIVLPLLTVTSPDGGEDWYCGISKNITWTSEGGISNALALTYSTDSGSTYPNGIVSNIYNGGSYGWALPAATGTGFRVKIADTFYQVLKDTNSTQLSAGTASQTAVSGTGAAANVQLALNGSVYYTSGNFTSRAIDTGDSSTNAMGKLTCSSTIPANTTLKFQLAAAASSDGPWTFTGPDTSALGSVWEIFYPGNSSAPQHFHEPSAVCVDTTNNKVFVMDQNAFRVISFDSGSGGTTLGANWQTFGSVQDQYHTNGFGTSSGICVDAVHNKVFVADTVNNRIASFDSGTGGTTLGNNWAHIRSGFSFSYPRAIYVDPATNKIWVADQYNNRVVRFDSGTGDTTFGGNLEATPNLGTGVKGIAVDTLHNKAYTSDYNGDRIYIFDSGSGGTTLGGNSSTFGTFGTGSGQFDTPMSIQADPVNNKLYVLDYINNRIVRFDSGTGGTTIGANWEPFGSYGTGTSKFNYPGEIYLDTVNYKVYVPDQMNERIVKISAGVVDYYTYNTQAISSALAGQRYLKYKAYFTTSDTAVTPTLNDVSISFTSGSAGQRTVSDASAADFSITNPHLAFTTEPANARPGATMANVVVAIKGASNQTLTDATNNVTLAVTGGSATLSGTTTVAAVAGVATFNNINIQASGSYTLTATSGTYTSAQSVSFTIAPLLADATKVAFTTQPSSSTVAGVAFAQQPVVTIQDTYGNTVTAATDNVTIAIDTNTGAGTLSGTATVAAVNGVATFSGLNIDKAASGYYLKATSGALTSARSNSLSITVAPAAKLAFTRAVKAGDYTIGGWNYGICYDPVNDVLWVGSYYANTLLKVNRSTGAVITSYAMGGYVNGVCFDAATKSVWVALNAGLVKKFNPATGEVIGTYTSNTSAYSVQDVCFDPSTNSVWATNAGGTPATVTKFNAFTGEKIGEYPCQNTGGGYRMAICFDPSTNSVWVTNYNSSSASKIRCSDGAKIGDYAGNLWNPIGVCFDSSTNSIWVANVSGTSVTKFNASTGAKIGEYKTSCYNSSGILYDPLTNSIWVGHLDQAVIDRLNAATGELIESFPSQGYNVYLCFDPASKALWASNWSAGKLTKINIAESSFTPGTMYAGINSNRYVVLARDAFDNLRDADALSVNLSSSSGTGRFDTGYNNAFDGSVTSITTAAGLGTFYYKDTVAPSTVTLTAGSGSLTSATIDQAVAVGPIKKYTLNAPGDIQAGNRAAYTVSRFDQYDNPKTSALSSGTIIGKYQAGPNGSGPYAVMYDATSDSIWVGNYTAPCSVTKYRASDGVKIGEYMLDTYAGPQDLAYDPVSGAIWTCNRGGHSITKIRLSDGAYWNKDTNDWVAGTVSTSTFAVGTSPSAICYDPAGYIWAANENSHNITKIRCSDGAKIGDYPVTGSAYAICYDPAGYIWAGERSNSYLAKFQASDGTRLQEYSITDSDPYDMIYVNGYLWVANLYGGNVSKFNLDGTKVANYGSGMSYTRKIIYDPATNTILAQGQTKMIKFNADTGAVIQEYTPDFTNTTMSVDLDPSTGSLWYCNLYNKTVTKMVYNDLATAYLYRSPANGSFYDAESAGSAVTSRVFSAGSATANFWFGTSTIGDYTVTVSDNSTAGDSANITDATDSITVTPNLSGITVTMTGLPASQTAGDAATVTVTLRDQYNNLYTSYTGTMHFTSTDAQAVLPADYTFTEQDAGAHTFTSAVTLKTSGSQTVTATDTVTGSFTAGQSSTVAPAAVNSLAFATQPATTAAAGIAFTTQPVVRLLDIYNNICTNNSTLQVTLAPVLALDNATAASGVLGGTTTKTAVNGTVTYTDINYSNSEAIKLVASSASTPSLASNVGKYLVVSDGTGKSITGWVKAAGSGEVLESDLFNAGEGTFESGTGHWAAGAGCTLSNDAGTLKVANGNANLSLSINGGLTSNLVINHLYKLTFQAKVSAGGHFSFGLSGSEYDMASVTSTNFTNITGYFTSTSLENAITTGYMGAGESAWFDNFILKKVVAPSTSGATIVTAQSGTVYNWASKDTGFIRNNAAYTYQFYAPKTYAATKANTKISAVDGTAFVDFGGSVLLTPYIGKYIVVTDSAGKKIKGYIKTAGTGETGTELVTNGDFASSAGWTVDPGWSIDQGVAASNASSHGARVMRTSDTAQSAGTLLKVIFEIKSFTSGTGYNYLDDSIHLAAKSSIGTHTEYYSATTTVVNFGIRSMGPAIGSVDNFSVIQVTAPSNTGVTIVSTSAGATYNWESKEAGFNYNDASGYTCQIYDSVSLPPTSGKVTQANMKLSLVDGGGTASGGAFVDFTQSGLLTPYIGKYLVIKDSTGKMVKGYIKTAGSAETLSAEIVDAWTKWSGYSTGWTLGSGTNITSAINTVSENGFFGKSYSPVVGALYKLTNTVVVNSGYAPKFGFANIAMNYSPGGASPVLFDVNATSYRTAVTNQQFADDRFLASNYGNPWGDGNWSLSGLSLKKVLAPSNTGVTIVKGASGNDNITYNWAAQDAGFNANDANGYSYEIRDTADTTVNTVTLANTKLSMVNGAAFVDFGASIGLNNYVGKYLIIKDSAGKMLTGYVKAAGQVETYGTERVPNGSFDTDTTGWSVGNPATTSISVVPGGLSGNCLAIMASSGAEQYAHRSVTASDAAGKLFKMSMAVKSGSSGNGHYKGGFQPTWWPFDGTTTASWVTVTSYKIYSADLPASFLCDKLDGLPGTMLFDEVSVRQVLTPGPTGATIVSTAGGSTQNWASEDSGFNRYDANGYTYGIYDAPGPVNTSTVLSDTKLSLTNGVAFVDFGTPGTLTSNIGRYIVITDTNEKKIAGWIGAVGTGETYGSDMFDPGKGTFSDGTINNWNLYGTTTGIAEDQGGGNYALKLTYADSSTGGYVYLNSANALSVDKVVGSLYRYDCQSKVSPTGASVQIRLNDEYSTRTIKTETSNTFQSSYIYSTRPEYPVFGDLGPGESVYLDNLTLRQVLTPSVTGVKIYSTKALTDQNWAVVQAGFYGSNPNGYTYSIYDSATPPTATGSNGRLSLIDGTAFADFGGIGNATSNSITPPSAAASKMSFTTQPATSAAAGAAFTTQPVIKLYDQFGNLCSGDNATQVTISAVLSTDGTTAGTGTLGGTVTRTAAAGVVTFTDLSYNKVEKIKLKATATGVTTINSSELIVSPAAAATFGFSTQPATTASAGVAFTIQPVVRVYDQYNNFCSNDSSTVVNLSAVLASDGTTAGAGTLNGTKQITVANGIATFSDLNYTKVENIKLRASSGALTVVNSNTITMAAGAVTKLEFQTQPATTAAAGVAFTTQPVVNLYDQYNNLCTNDSATQITLSAVLASDGITPGTGALGGTFTKAATAGVVTYTDVSYSKSEAIKITASSSANPTLASNIGKYLVVNDGSGRTISGWVKAAGGAQETYGLDLLTNADFNLGDTGWSKGAGWTIIDQGGGDYEGVATAAAASAIFQQYSSLVIDALYHGESICTNFTTGNIQTYAYTTTTYSGNTLTGTGTSSLYFTPGATTANIGARTITNNTTLRVDDISFKQVLVPGPTGAKIVSAQSGAVYNWANKDTGFSLNNSAGYTYALYAPATGGTTISIPPTSGAVTQANMKLSLVDGGLNPAAGVATAFVDFSTANTLTPYIGKYLIIRDSAGKMVKGYIKAAGTGETNGNEVVLNPEFTTDTSNWSKNSLDSLTRVDSEIDPGVNSGGVDKWCLKLTAGASGAYANTSGQTGPAGALMYIGPMRIYNANRDVNLITSVSFQTISASAAWKSTTGAYKTSTGSTFFISMGGSSVAGDVIYIDKVSFKQVLTPSTTGVVIVKGASGADNTTYNWQAQDAGFNANDSSGYSYEIRDTADTTVNSVTQANAKLSIVNGTAFADFGSSAALNNYVGKYLVIKDSKGKQLTGYIKQVGVGEVYGDDVVLNGNMESATPSWSNQNGSSFSLVADERRDGAGIQSLNVVRGTATNTAYQQVTVASGGLYYGTAWVKNINATTGVKVTPTLNPLLAPSYHSGTNWSDQSYYVKANSTTLSLTVYISGSADGQQARVDDVTLKQVLTPGPTGVTIVSTAGGNTQNWASEETGFNRNDANGYTYGVYDNPAQISGTAPQTNTKLSLVDGAAFVDFSTSGALTSNIGKYIVVKDSAGNSYAGWIKAAGLVETLETDILSGAGNFSSSTGWTAETGWNISGGIVSASNASQWSAVYRTAAPAYNVGGAYKATYDASGVTGQYYINPMSSAHASNATGTGLSLYGTAMTTSYVGILAAINSLTGTFDNLTIQQVLTPGPTGATIVSTQDGTTQNWAVKGASFNPNDANGYTYQIYDTATPPVVTQANAKLSLVDGGSTASGGAFADFGGVAGVTSSELTPAAAAATKIVFTSVQQTLTAGVASSAITVQLQDAFGNLSSGAVALTLASTSAQGRFDTVSAGAFNGTVTSITTVGGIGTFYYKDSLTGTPVITVSGTGLTSAQQQETVSPAAAAQVVITSSTQTLTAGVASSAYTVQVQDALGNLRPADALTINLASDSGTGKFDVASAGAFNGTITSITTSAGIGTFYYKDTFSGGASATSATPTITVSSAGLTSGTQQQTVLPNETASITIANASQSMAAGTRTQNSISRFDAYNNLTITGTSSILLSTNSTAANAKFYDAASAGNVISALSIGSGSSSGDLWYYDTRTSTPTYTLTASLLGTAPAAPTPASGLANSQFYFPFFIAVDSANNVYVTDWFNNRVQKFDSSGQFVSKFGSAGSADGQLNQPEGIAIDSSGNIYIADSVNNRVQKFDSSGTFVSKFGSAGSADGQFNTPRGLALDTAGNIYVVDSGNNRVQKFDSSGAFVLKFGSAGSGNEQFNTAMGIALDSGGNIYVADQNNHRVQKFDSSGAYVSQFGTVGSGDGQLNSPTGLAFDAAGNIYVAEYGNHRIQKFDSSGVYVSKFGSQGTASGQLNKPIGIAIVAGNIWEIDFFNHRLQVFSLDGAFIRGIGNGTTWDAIQDTETYTMSVRHAAPDHLQFSSAITPPSKVGVPFTLPAIQCYDQFNNLADNTNGATAYNGAKTISYVLSGATNAPNASATDSWVTNVSFSSTTGASTTTLATTLYRAQTTTITPVAGDLAGGNVASEAITINPDTAVGLGFTQEPSATALTNASFTTQPQLAIRDTYGNQTPDNYDVKLFASSTTGNSSLEFTSTSGILTSDQATNQVTAVSGLAAFTGVKYDTAGQVYLYAEVTGHSEIAPAFSQAVTVATAQTTTVEVSTSAVADFNLIPTHDTLAEAFGVIGFKVHDNGVDQRHTWIDQLKITIAGSGQHAANDIAAATLYKVVDSVKTKVADAVSITDQLITFGLADGANNDLAAGLYDLDDAASMDFVVEIYMKPEKLLSMDKQTYTFGITESNITVDGAQSSGMAPNSAPGVSTVIGTLKVDVSNMEIVNLAGASTASATAGTPFQVLVRATDANKNIDVDYVSNHTLIFTGLSSIGSAPSIYIPKVNTTINFGNSITLSFNNDGTHGNGAVVANILPYKKEVATIVAQESGQSYTQSGLVSTVSATTAAKLAITSGNNQTRGTGSQLDPFLAMVSDTYGNPAGGEETSVNFAIAAQPTGAGAVLSRTADYPGRSGTAGEVSTVLTLGSIAGSYQVTVTSTGLTGSPLSFNSTALAPGTIQVITGADQSAQVTAALGTELRVKIMDASTPPTEILNQPVTFTISSVPDGATGYKLGNNATVYSTATDANGAGTTLTLGQKSGTYKVTVSSPGTTSYDFVVTATPKPATHVAFALPLVTSVNAGVVSSAFTIATQDEYDNNSNYASAYSLASSSATGAFYNNSSGTGTPITSVSIPTGSATANFWYKDTATGSANITVTQTSLPALATQTVVQAISLLPGDAYRFTVIGSADTIATGGTKALTITLYDSIGNVLSNYTANLDVVFSGANPSPAATVGGQGTPATCIDRNLVDVPFGTATSLSFTNGVAYTNAKLYKAESVTIKATSGSLATADSDDLSFIVKHGAANHLKFSANLPSSVTAGQEFSFGSTLALEAVDLFNNICDGANAAVVFGGNKEISWDISGDKNGPEDNVSDYFIASGAGYGPTTITFASGVSTTPLKAKLFTAQATTITASCAEMQGVNIPSNSVSVAAEAAAKLRFTQEPSGSCVTSQALAMQPQIAVSDQYGNPVAGASATVSLSACLDTNGTPATHTLSATGGLSKGTVGGIAAFEGVTYNYPEDIFLKATVTGGLNPIYSSKVSFATAQEATFERGVSNPATISSLAISGSPVTIIDFNVQDTGNDGFATKIKQIVVKRDTTTTPDTTGGWVAYIGGATLSDGVSAAVPGIVEDNQISFNDLGYSVANSGEKTFTISVHLKAPLPLGADGKLFSFKIDPSINIGLDPIGSRLGTYVNLACVPTLTVAATDFKITGSAAMNAGTSQTITIKAVDTQGNIDLDYGGEQRGDAGSKTLRFSGANVALKVEYKPTASAGNIIFGSDTPVSFTNGSATTTIILYKAETAMIKATAAEGNLVTANANALSCAVTGGTATDLNWSVQPVAEVVENAPWQAFSVALTDAYGNTSPSSAVVTIAPDVITGGEAVVAGNTATAQSGVATFSEFAVSGLDDAGQLKISAASPGLNATPLSNLVTIYKKYDITLNVKDYTSGTALTEFSLNATKNGEQVTGFPKSGNSPMTFSLPYGTYVFTVSKDQYVDSNESKIAGVAADFLDAQYDHKIAWTLTAMSVSEATSDYNVKTAYVYDESSDRLTIRLWLERRGMLITGDAVNKLGSATVRIYNDTIAPPLWFDPITVTSANEGIFSVIKNNVVAGGGDIQLVGGRTYYAKATIGYGGSEGIGRTYESGATFSVTVQEALKTITSAIQSVTTNIAGQTTEIKSVVKDEIKKQVEDVLVPKISEVKTQTADILTAATETLPAKLQEVKQQVVTEIQPSLKSGILTRENTVKQGGTLAIRYRAMTTGLAPVLNVYSPKEVLLVANKAMGEVGATGVYEANVTFATAWGTGDFSVICSEAANGTADALVISVVQTDIETVSGNVAAVLGNTGGISNLKNVTTQIGSQFNEMDRVLAKISKDIAGKLGEAKGAVAEMTNAFTQLESLSAQIKKIGGTTGINLEKLYEVSKDKQGDITYIKNKSEELKAAMEINQKMIENVAKKPVVQTWFEFK